MCGLCGNYNGDADDDFLGKGEKLYGNAVDFAQSWKHGKKQCDIGLSQNEVSCCPHLKLPCCLLCRLFTAVFCMPFTYFCCINECLAIISTTLAVATWQ